MRSRLYVSLLMLVAPCVFAAPHIYPGHLSPLPPPVDGAPDALTVRLVAQTSSTGAGLDSDRIEREDDVVRIFTTIVEGPFPAFGSVTRDVTIEDATDGSYRVEFHARSMLAGTDPSYGLLDAKRVAFAEAAMAIPANPTTLDPVTVRVPTLAGCGPVASVELDHGTWADPAPDPPTSVGFAISLRYETWPCSGDAGPRSVLVPLHNDSPTLPAGDYSVFVSHGASIDPGEGASEIVDGEVLAFRVRDTPSPRIAGTWYAPSHPGQGLTLQTQPSGELVLGWYTFNAAGEPAWILAQGTGTGREAMLQALTTAGGVFPSMPGAAAAATPWGTVDVEFTDCNHLTLAWATDVPNFADGSIEMTRLTSQDDLVCGEAMDNLQAGRWQIVASDVTSATTKARTQNP